MHPRENRNGKAMTTIKSAIHAVLVYLIPLRNHMQCSASPTVPIEPQRPRVRPVHIYRGPYIDGRRPSNGIRQRRVAHGRRMRSCPCGHVRGPCLILYGRRLPASLPGAQNRQRCWTWGRKYMEHGRLHGWRRFRLS